MLQTNSITDPLEGKSGQMKIPELAGAVQGSGIINDMIVDMCPIHMGADNKSILAFCPSHPQLIAHPVGLLRRDLSRLERLPNLIRYDIVLLLPPSDILILTFGKEKLLVRRLGCAGVARDIFSAVRFGWIFRIIRAISQGLRNRPALIDMKCNQSRCCHSAAPISQE